MFSGIVEAQSQVLQMFTADQAVRILVERPTSFTDIKVGDSIATNGVCLTVEKFDEKTIQFCLGAETLAVLKTSISNFEKYPLNLERSLKFGERVHGHLVTGHVDALCEVVESYKDGDCWQMRVSLPDELKSFFWKKGSACLNGVSLTVNAVEKKTLAFCLIPETIHATNLTRFKSGNFLNLEADYLAKAYIFSRESKEIGL